MQNSKFKNLEAFFWILPFAFWNSDRSAEWTRPAVVGQRRFQFRLPPGEGGGIIKMLDLLGAVWLNHDQLEAHIAGSGTSFAPDKRALTFVEPHHAAQTIPRGGVSLA